MAQLHVINATGFLKTVGATGATGATGAAGSDGWTDVVLASDFTHDTTSFTNVTGLKFTPVANTIYAIRGQLLMRTATANIGVRPGIAWPTSPEDGVLSMTIAGSAAGTISSRHGNVSAAIQPAQTGLQTNTESYTCDFIATLVSGASVSGDFQVQIANESGTTVVTFKKGSWISYRAIA
jgi:hypothetical protein